MQRFWMRWWSFEQTNKEMKSQNLYFSLYITHYSMWNQFQPFRFFMSKNEIIQKEKTYNQRDLAAADDVLDKRRFVAHIKRHQLQIATVTSRFACFVNHRILLFYFQKKNQTTNKQINKRTRFDCFEHHWFVDEIEQSQTATYLSQRRLCRSNQLFFSPSKCRWQWKRKNNTSCFEFLFQSNTSNNNGRESSPLHN